MWRTLCIFCFLLLAPVAVARAQLPQPNRVLRLIDFEERKLGNNEDLPMHWVKISGRGLPHYVNGYLSTDKAHSGQYSFRFDLNGGSLVYRYDPTQIPVMSGARYRVQVYCQTTQLANARARMTAYFTDLDGHPLPDMVRHTELYASPAEGGGWKRLSIELDANNPNAAYLAVELGLLQPELYSPPSLGDQTLWPQDIRGSAWFDDVSVAQVPEVTLGTDRPGNIFRLGDPPRMWVKVNDLFLDDLQSRLVLSDASGRAIFQRSGAIDMSGAQRLGPALQKLNIPLPKLSAGWYRADLQMTSRGRDLGAQSTNLVLLADTAEPTPPDPRFGVNATDLTPPELEQLGSILPLLSAGRVKVAVWSQESDIAPAAAGANGGAGDDDVTADATNRFDLLLEQLQEEGITPTGCLVGLPQSIMEKIGADPDASPTAAWLKLLQSSPDAWQPQLAYLISRHANHLSCWQLGPDGTEDFVSDPRMRKVYTLVYDQFSQLIHNPDLAMPWPAWYDLGKHLPATVALSVPPQVLPEQIPLYMHDLLRPDPSDAGARRNFSVSLELLDDSYGRAVRLRDLARRVIFALAGGANRIDLPLPFTAQTYYSDVSIEPEETFIIDRTLMRILGGSQFKGMVHLGEGVQTMLFDRDGQGVLAMWSRSGQTQRIALNLGSQSLKVDLWGNVTPLTQVNQNVTLDIGPMPFFVVGVDSQLMQLRASLAFDRPLLESSFQTHTRRVSFVNPSNNTLSGILQLRPPIGWSITPATFQFSVEPGRSFDEEVTIDFPYNSIAGDKTVDAMFSLEGENGADFHVPLTLTLGLSDVGMQSLALRVGKNLMVQEMITNYGESPIDYTAFAAYPGEARQERLVSGLEPGRTEVKLFKFENVQFIGDTPVRCGLRQLEGTRVLNSEAPIQ